MSTDISTPSEQSAGSSPGEVTTQETRNTLVSSGAYFGRERYSEEFYLPIACRGVGADHTDDCVGPAALECVDEAGFDLGGDVGVDVFDLVGDFVAESAGLGDVGDAVGDEPGFVAVAEAVEGQPGHDGLYSYAWSGAVEVAVGGWSHGAPGEVGAAQ